MTSHPSTLNLGIVAHVDAGKTSLTERLLFEAGAIEAPGSVDAGTTRTDSLDLERRRGITIRAAVTSFALGDVVVNLLDTPGHPDFIAEVERSLGVLDAAVLVLSSVEGVQPQTVVIWRALQRIGVPTILFVNKVDRSGADVAGVLDQVRSRLTPSVVPLTQAHGAGARDARVSAVPLTRDDVVVALAEGDDQMLDNWASGHPVSAAAARAALRRGLRTGALTPALCGSAITGAGLPLLCDALVTLLPRPSPPPGERAATVFAVDRDERGRRAWVRVWSGELRVRDRLEFGSAEPARVTEVAVSTPAGLRRGWQARARSPLFAACRPGSATLWAARRLAGCTGSRRPRCKPSSSRLTRLVAGPCTRASPSLPTRTRSSTYGSTTSTARLP